jgi:hypothetical protein
LLGNGVDFDLLGDWRGFHAQDCVPEGLNHKKLLKKTVQVTDAAGILQANEVILGLGQVQEVGRPLS